MAQQNGEKTEKRRIGDVGEAIARKFLKGKGFNIIESNYRKKWGEIDIVVEKKKRIHFIEVKTLRENIAKRRGDYNPAENVHEKKLKRLFATAYSYLGEHGKKGAEWQIDVVTVRLDERRKKALVQHIEDVIM